MSNNKQGCQVREKLKYFLFSSLSKSRGISFLVRQFYNIAIKKSGKDQGIVKNSAHNIVIK